MLERDPKKPIGLSFQALLRRRGTKDIAKQSLTPDDIERARLCLRVELASYRSTVYGCDVIQGFHDQGSADVYDDANTPAARRTLSRALWRVAQRSCRY